MKNFLKELIDVFDYPDAYPTTGTRLVGVLIGFTITVGILVIIVGLIGLTFSVE